MPSTRLIARDTEINKTQCHYQTNRKSENWSERNRDERRNYTLGVLQKTGMASGVTKRQTIREREPRADNGETEP